MKKYFYTLLASAGMLLATSCSHDDMANEIGGENTIVTFKVNLPEEAVSRTTDSDSGKGENVNALIFAMYEEDTEEVLICKDYFVGDDDKETGISKNEDGTFIVSVPMAKDLEYDLLFLAYNKENCAFHIVEEDPALTNLKALQFKEKLTANLDAYDAFVGKLDSQGITPEGTTTVTLKRPFAQINAASLQEDIDNAEQLNASVKKSAFRIYNVPRTYNVLKETTSQEKIEVVEFEMSFPKKG